MLPVVSRRAWRQSLPALEDDCHDDPLLELVDDDCHDDPLPELVDQPDQ